MDSMKFNTTTNYEYITVLGRDCAYTQDPVDPHSLPEGYHPYGLVPGPNASFCALSPEITPDTKDLLIAKEPFVFPPGENLLLEDGDCHISEEEFNFESYFGQKLSIDAQIEQAETKRDLLLEASRAGKQRSTFHAQDTSALQL